MPDLPDVTVARKRSAFSDDLHHYEASVVLEWPAHAVITGFCDGMSAESPEVKALGYSESEATAALAVNLEDFAVDLERLAAQARQVSQRLKPCAMAGRRSATSPPEEEGRRC